MAVRCLGRNRDFQTRRDGFAASAGEGGTGEARGHVEDRAVCFEMSAHAYTEDQLAPNFPISLYIGLWVEVEC